MKRLTRLAVPFLASGLVALVLPWSSATAGEKPSFSGHNAYAWAAPVKIEFYEPTIPIPANPQFEIELGYSRVEAETGLARGRGSWLWPGDPVGEGAKTFAEQLGLPDQLGENGYPVQVNAEYPSGAESQRDEPFPGTVMRTAADAARVVADVGYSTDGEVQDPEADGGDGGGDGDAPVPGLPADGLEDFGDAITGEADTTAASEKSAEPVLPPELTALVDLAGYVSTSEAVTGGDVVRTVSRSAAQEVSLLSGLVLVEGVSARMVTSSDGKRASATGTSRIGTLTLAGTRFSLGPDGVEAAGQGAPIPGLPDDPAKALAQLGLELFLSKPDAQRRGDQALGLAEGLRVVIDTTQLRSTLADLPLGEVIGAVPDEAKELNGLLQAVAGLSPKIVITLGNAGTAVDTVQGVVVPPAPEAPTGDGGGDAGDGSGGGAGGGLPAGGAPGAPADTGSTPAADDALAGTEPVAAGLPPLNSVPGALLVGGVGLAAAGGTWLRKIGVLALGGAASCPHGLDSGLPDLRKA